MTGEFCLSQAQKLKFKEWAKENRLAYAGAVGGEYTFCFTPTSIGTVIKVKHATGAELDLSDYENW